MCIIILCPPNKRPTKAEISNSMYNNPDGAGIAYNTKGGKVHIIKGMETFTQVWNAIKQAPRESALLFHARIATHGKVIAENCHPFTISSNPAVLGKTEIYSNIAIAHNGIIPASKPRAGISDTMEFILTQLVLLYEVMPDFYKVQKIREMLANATASKWAVIDGDGHIETIGTFTKKGGIFYSNASANYKYQYYDNTDKIYPQYTRTKRNAWIKPIPEDALIFSTYYPDRVWTHGDKRDAYGTDINGTLYCLNWTDSTAYKAPNLKWYVLGRDGKKYVMNYRDLPERPIQVFYNDYETTPPLLKSANIDQWED